MFRLIFISRCKCMVRDRQTLFWTMLFPILLASFFGLALGHIHQDETFTRIPIAVVDSAAYRQDSALRAALAAVSDRSAADPMFRVSEVSPGEAESLLKKGKIAGYLDFSGGVRVVVRESGMNQTVLTEFVHNALQTQRAVGMALQADPNAASAVASAASAGGDYLKNVSPGRSQPDETVVYYYALIALSSLYGAFWGLQEVSAVQADLSPQGARVSVAPVHKLQVFGYSLLAAVCIQFLCVLLLVVYMATVLGVKFGSNMPFILLACLAGCFAGVAFGALIGAVVRQKMGIKTAILIAGTLTMSFLAGMMSDQVKYAVTRAVPVLAYVNPGNLIADAFYALYYYTGYGRYFLNIGLLFAFSALCYLLVYFVMRRQRYESI